MGDSAEDRSTCVVTDLLVTVKDEMHPIRNINTQNTLTGRK